MENGNENSVWLVFTHYSEVVRRVAMVIVVEDVSSLEPSLETKQFSPFPLPLPPAKQLKKNGSQNMFIRKKYDCLLTNPIAPHNPGLINALIRFISIMNL